MKDSILVTKYLILTFVGLFTIILCQSFFALGQTDVEKQFNKYMMKGLNYRYKIKYNEAINEYKKAIKLKPTSSLGYIALARVYGLIGNYNEAEMNMQRAIIIDPNDGVYHAYYSFILLKLENYKEAIKEKKLSISFGCNTDRDYKELSDIYYMINDYSNGRNTVFEGLKTHPNSKLLEKQLKLFIDPPIIVLRNVIILLLILVPSLIIFRKLINKRKTISI